MKISKLKVYSQLLIGIFLFSLIVGFGYASTKRTNEFSALYKELQGLEEKKVETQWQNFGSRGDVERFVAHNYRKCLEENTSQSTCRASTVIIANTKLGATFSLKVLESIDRQEWVNVKLSGADEDRMTFITNRMSVLINEMKEVGI